MKRVFRIFISATIVFIVLIVVLSFSIGSNLNKKDTSKFSMDSLKELSKTVKDDRINILMLGVDNLDSTKESDAEMRTDTMMLFSVDPKTKTGFILSIPRDTRVSIDGYKYKKKINNAHSLGGVALTVKTVKDLLHIPIHHFVKVDYKAVFKTIDDMGGVYVDVPMDMKYDDIYAKPPLHIDIKKGYQRLDGKKSMEFLRFRHGYADADLGRIKAQQSFIQSVLKQAISPSSIKLIPSYIDTFSKYVTTDMSGMDMLKVTSKAVEIKPYNIKKETLVGRADLIGGISYYVYDEDAVKKQVDFLTSGSFYVDKDPEQKEKVASDTKNSSEKVSDSIKNKPPESKTAEKKDDKKAKPKKIPYVVVLNGDGRNGLSQRAKDLLYVNNIDVKTMANADNFKYENSIVYYWDDEKLASDVADILGCGLLKQSKKAYYGKPVDILVILGKDFTK